ncbi:hypothetical protein [Agrobacterium rosae]|uniref:hypothetical protein n=1 Tax=Agrobacterium rosae TaxID=1972867 RepID=UPI0011AEEA43|nr:hypothetical protein [Agrobacterium rosae]
MKRAFVGFSSCIAYDYQNKATKAASDLQSSPNPIMYGSTGLLLLYDEIWFACRSVAPESLRSLPYVHFLDEKYPDIYLGEDFDKAIEDIDISMTEALKETDDRYNSTWSEVTEHVSRNGVDNHTHGISALGKNFGGNATQRNLAIDLALIDKFPGLGLEIVLNPLTVPAIYSPFGFVDQTDNLVGFSNMELTHRLLTFGELYDYVGNKGPYHPILDEMRNDRLLEEFRRWVGANTSILDNQEIRAIEKDVNTRLRELRIKSLEKYVSKKHLIQAPAQMLKSAVLGLVPPANGIAKLVEIIKANRKAESVRWQAFIAISKERYDEVENSREKPQ